MVPSEIVGVLKSQKHKGESLTQWTERGFLDDRQTAIVYGQMSYVQCKKHKTL